ncbi:hypothetical protein [Arthrobacter sp. C152]
MVKTIMGLLSRALQRPGSFNSAMLEQHRDGVFMLLHQQLGGLR